VPHSGGPQIATGPSFAIKKMGKDPRYSFNKNPILASCAPERANYWTFIMSGAIMFSIFTLHTRNERCYNIFHLHFFTLHTRPHHKDRVVAFGETASMGNVIGSLFVIERILGYAG
jgi:hypothetical protein